MSHSIGVQLTQYTHSTDTANIVVLDTKVACVHATVIVQVECYFVRVESTNNKSIVLIRPHRIHTGGFLCMLYTHRHWSGSVARKQQIVFLWLLLLLSSLYVDYMHSFHWTVCRCFMKFHLQPMWCGEINNCFSNSNNNRSSAFFMCCRLRIIFIRRMKTPPVVEISVDYVSLFCTDVPLWKHTLTQHHYPNADKQLNISFKIVQNLLNKQTKANIDLIWWSVSESRSQSE